MTTANLMKYILVVFRPGGEHMVLATSDCYEDLQYHQTIHGLQGFTQIINSKNFKRMEVANERINSRQN